MKVLIKSDRQFYEKLDRHHTKLLQNHPNPRQTVSDFSGQIFTFESGFANLDMMRRLRNDREGVADNCERVAARCICASNTHLLSDDDDYDDGDGGVGDDKDNGVDDNDQ